MLSRFLARTLNGQTLSSLERVMLAVVFVIVEILGSLAIASIASMFGGIFGGEKVALVAGVLAIAAYVITVIVSWIAPAKRRV